MCPLVYDARLKHTNNSKNQTCSANLTIDLKGHGQSLFLVVDFVVVHIVSESETYEQYFGNKCI